MNKTVSDLCFNIESQPAIMTDASSSLGVTFTETLAEVGENLVIATRRYEKLEKVSRDLNNRFKVKVVPVKTDVTQENRVTKMVKTAIDEFGSVEILVNNAGIASLNPSADMTIEEWKKVIDVNLTGVFLRARTATPEMIKNNYRKIVNIASTYGAVGDIFHAASYYASKGAVNNLTRAFAME